ncbi:unnamed protein product [Leptosia nina]|uniref:Uncharacterized protein n=1 Tax=Leptosia nina TaxID=320188 RepID=A0AAV1J3V0_9NEOP
MKKSFKAKNTFVTNDQLLHLSPLQKARRALQVALKKAIQETYDLDSAKQSADQSCPTEYEDEQDDFQEEDNIELDWTISTEISKDTENNLPPSAEYVREVQQNTEMAKNSYGTASNGSLIHFSDDLCQHSIDNFTTPFLSMPDLESEPTEDNSGIEILAEFHIKNEIDQGITKKSEKENDTHSLNCVLPSVSNDQNDDITFAEPTEDTDHYHGEWDQMFCDIITNKSSSQDSVSNLKDLYSQISQTIDLLNS